MLYDEHVHFHVCAVDGVFEEVTGDGDAADAASPTSPPRIVFHPASAIDADAVAQVQASLRRRILRAFVGRGLLEGFEAKEMLAYQHSEPGNGQRYKRDAKQSGWQSRRRTTPYATGVDSPHCGVGADEVFPLLCPICGGQMRIIAFITHSVDIHQILNHIGVEAQPPRITPARGPLLWEGFDAQMGDGADIEPDWDEAAQPAPVFEVDQRVSW